MLVYRSAWLKCYHPGAFYTALLNHQPMGFWSPAVLVNDARRHHIQVLPVDIHQSQGRCHWDGKALRLGLNYVKGFGDQHIQQVLETREKQPFRDLHDLCQRTQLPRRLVEYLILAGAVDGWKPDRRALLWKLGTISYAEDTLALAFETEPVDLPQQTHLEALSQEYQTLGVMLHEHPLRVVRIRSAGEEVPTWYAVPQNDGEAFTPGISKGLWNVSDRVFGSTVGTPRTQQYKRNITKTNTNKAAVNTPNPGFYELTAAFLRGDDAAEIVSMVHHLRAASAQSTDETGHSLPLHLARRIEEYLLWVVEQEMSEDESVSD